MLLTLYCPRVDFEACGVLLTPNVETSLLSWPRRPEHAFCHLQSLPQRKEAAGFGLQQVPSLKPFSADLGRGRQNLSKYPFGSVAVQRLISDQVRDTTFLTSGCSHTKRPLQELVDALPCCHHQKNGTGISHSRCLEADGLLPSSEAIAFLQMRENSFLWLYVLPSSSLLSCRRPFERSSSWTESHTKGVSTLFPTPVRLLSCSQVVVALCPKVCLPCSNRFHCWAQWLQESVKLKLSFCQPT
mmetsp:Transcript_5684/g.16909  ORF Transcript_5684/g.16909 Transcript_5684/m.16909 type:complete len:243 (-) Transcript_5684:109-837(-)